MGASSSRPILVIGATGTVGKEVVQALLARGAAVAALVRTQGRAAALPAAVDRITGDLQDAAAVQRAVARAHAVFFVNPHEADEEQYAEHVLAACERAEVRLVFLGVHVGVTGVDVRDIAEVAATLLLDPAYPAGCFPITGPEAVSGPEAAAIWAEALGRPVAYAGDDRAAWTRAITTHLTGHKREDWLKTYKALAKLSGGPNPVELARTTALLGRAPRTYRAYVHDVVAALATPRRDHGAIGAAAGVEGRDAHSRAELHGAPAHRTD